MVDNVSLLNKLTPLFASPAAFGGSEWQLRLGSKEFDQGDYIVLVWFYAIK